MTEISCAQRIVSFQRTIFISYTYAETEIDAIREAKRRLGAKYRILNVERLEDGWIVTVEGNGDDPGY